MSQPLMIEPREKDLGGFSVRRVLPFAKRRMVGPWIFFDHLGPVVFEAGKGIDVRPHPHINLATVTYLFEGEMLHRDSLGSHQVIRPGDLNLMVAGSGIVHSERERAEIHEKKHPLHALQLWHALPQADEECDPAFYHYGADELPQTNVNGVSLRVMMGSAYGLQSPVKSFCDTLYVEMRLKEGQSIALPQAQELAVYVVNGSVQLGELRIAQYAMCVVGERAELVASDDALVTIIGGEPLGERFVEWNFVSSRKERIEQAKADWKAQRFAKVPDDAIEFIPLPE